MADPQTPTEYLDEPGLIRYDSKRKLQNEATYVKREKVDGEDSREKVLSDNNFTDELKDKLENSDYDDLENIPTLDGLPLQGTMTSEELGIAKSEDVATDIAAAKGEMEEYVNTKLSSTYKPAGSVTTIEGLPALTAENLGKVYNVEASFVTTENFVEGAGKDYPAGTNVVIVEQTEGVYKYDALAGFFDTTGLMPADSIKPIPNSKIDALFD